MSDLRTSEEIKEAIPKLPDCVKVEYQTFPQGSEVYLIATFNIREEITFTLEIGHSYSFVKYGECEIYPDRMEVEASWTKGFKTDFSFYLGDRCIARIPLEKDD